MTFSFGCGKKCLHFWPFLTIELFGREMSELEGKMRLRDQSAQLSRSLFMFSELLTFSAAG